MTLSVIPLQKWGQIYFSISAVRFGGINKSVPFFRERGMTP
jgi:hypothetical protein